LARKKCKGAKLEVFSNKAATLNRLIFELLRAKKELATYDAYLEVRRIKGFKHTKLQTVDARMKKLLQQRLIVKKGTKKTQPGTDASLYQLSSRAVTALELDKVSMDRFLMEANDELLLEMARLLASFRECASKAKHSNQS